jgi:2-methylisocitrate lyase-like PEP mutase family enzyme
MSAATRLRALLNEPGIIVMPSCFDALSARLIERAGFRVTFMSGFAVAAARLGVPDTGLISYGEMVDQGRNICGAVSIPVIGDGDTGYGNALNVKRTVQGYAAAGFACVMIEDQVAPKRCGHTRGKQTVGRNEAFARVQAAVDARDAGVDIPSVWKRRCCAHAHSPKSAQTSRFWKRRTTKRRCTPTVMVCRVRRWPIWWSKAIRRFCQRSSWKRLVTKSLSIR